MMKKTRKAQRYAKKCTAPIGTMITAQELQHKYDKAMNKQKALHWKNWVEEITEQMVWTAHKYVTQPSASINTTRIPMLKTSEGYKASSSKDKAKVLLNTFSPPSPEADLSDVNDSNYLAAMHYDEISKEELKSAIKDLNLYKALDWMAYQMWSSSRQPTSSNPSVQVPPQRHHIGTYQANPISNYWRV
ncbi:hypothetical protein M422DRAFT_270244 [Sphaerobolus stellatus SS14]|uniref:Unplaced genomic scaffold SPHSTscaffold_230, whole genome shotgun sequence n=1 Tax=Sphaerobolus stellatus (strain SS14) TaxID=990650 RepID=A0A0C9U2U3_SPHS4|nr:hypothetical protein M422DRAFT_270244 [Sphaerobolus stellatus SS14]